MHESSLITNILKKLDAVATENHGKKIIGATIKLGAWSHISPEHFREHFNLAATGTAYANLRLVVEQQTDVNDANAQDIILDSVEIEE